MASDERYAQEIEQLQCNSKTSGIPYGFLSDTDIISCIEKKVIFIDSTDERFDYKEQIKGASIDLRLGTQARYIKKGLALQVGNKNDEKTYSDWKPIDRGCISISPYETILVNTMERLLIPADMIGFISGRSSIARMGLMIHCCQSFIVPGHIQNVPLQITNLTGNTITVEIGTRICQVELVHLNTPSSTPYYSRNDAKYVSERQNPLPSRKSMDNEHVNKNSGKINVKLFIGGVHRFLYHPIFVGIVATILSTFVMSIASLMNDKVYTVRGRAITAIILGVIFLSYIVEFIVHKDK